MAKFLVTFRPEPDIEGGLTEAGRSLAVDSEKSGDGLSDYIDQSVDALSSKKAYPEDLKTDVKAALSSKADGTFLWVSFILKDLAKSKRYEVRKKLENLPPGLDEVYDRILRQISEDEVSVANFVLQFLIVAQRPLTQTELATAYGAYQGI